MLEMSRRLAAEGHEVTVLTTNAGELEYFWNAGKAALNRPEQETHDGVTIHRLPIRHLPLATVSYPAVRRVMAMLSALPFDSTPVLRRMAALAPWMPALGRTLHQMQPDQFDLVMGMTICFESLLWPAFEYARQAGIPFVLVPLLHLGESENSQLRKYYTMRHQVALIRQADAVVALTEVERDYVLQQGVPAERVFVSGAGVDPKEVVGGDAQRLRSRLGRDGPVVTVLGTASYDKGTVHTVEAMRKLWAAGSNAHVVIAGTVLDQFRRTLSQLSPAEQERCHVLGPVDEQTKRDLLAAGSVFVMPSRSDSFGIVFLEAWLAGMPVIGAAAGGVQAVIDDGVDGFLVPFGDVDALAGRIEQLLQDRNLAQRMAENGQKKTLGRYTWDRVYQILRQVYSQVRPN